MKQREHYKFNLVLVGDTKIGKTNFLKRLSLNPQYDWNNTQRPTIGVDFSAFSCEIESQLIKLIVYDTAGNSAFQGSLQSYYRKAHGFLLIYDITNRDSFENITAWFKGIEIQGTGRATMILVANKSDLEDERQVSYEEGRLLAEKLGLRFFETSTKKAESIGSMIEFFVKEEIEKEKAQQAENLALSSQQKETTSFLSSCFST